MMSIPSTSKLELRTAYGPVYRTILNTPPRDCTPAEIPIIDLGPLFSSSFKSRASLAREIATAAEGSGFFYIKNHEIPDSVIEEAKRQALVFFHQPAGLKEWISQDKSKFFNGWRGPKKTAISVGDGVDVKESMSWRYSPQYDPDTKDTNAVPDEVKSWLRGEDYVWEGTSHLPGFKEAMLDYWSRCLILARKLVQIFALSLDLPETYFDDKVTYPGADSVLNYYPPRTAEEEAQNAIGLGSHTDLQSFTLLWQDMVGGLQVLTKEGQWIKAPPIPGTFVVNIGDFLMRLSNDRFKSTVHRVYNASGSERVSMPFFFGFNFNEVCSVLPSCTSEKNPPKYEPISCGDWCQLRFKQERDAFEAKAAPKNRAPDALVLAN